MRPSVSGEKHELCSFYYYLCEFVKHNNTTTYLLTLICQTVAIFPRNSTKNSLIFSLNRYSSVEKDVNINYCGIFTDWSRNVGRNCIINTNDPKNYRTKEGEGRGRRADGITQRSMNIHRCFTITDNWHIDKQTFDSCGGMMTSQGYVVVHERIQVEWAAFEEVGS